MDRADRRDGVGADGEWAGRMSRHLGGMYSRFPKEGSESIPWICLMFRSCDMCTEARSLSLAFSWTWGFTDLL